MVQILLDLLPSNASAGPVPGHLTLELAEGVGTALGLKLYPESLAIAEGALYALGDSAGKKRLVIVAADPTWSEGFDAEHRTFHLETTQLHAWVGDPNSQNARALRRIFPYLRPQVLGLQKSIGCGDRLGLATAGHVKALRTAALAGRPQVGLIAAQQSVRENGRTGRSPQQVLDDAMWGVFEEGWTHGYGADADHLKSPEDVEPWALAGYTLYTIDPGEYVDDEAEGAEPAVLWQKVEALPWDLLQSNPQDLLQRLTQSIDIGTEKIQMTQEEVLRAAAKYGAAVAHTLRMYRAMRDAMGERPFELEVSVDETAHVTRIEEHLYIAHELRRLGVEWVSLAPRYVGSFEKGVDYIGDPQAFRREFIRHVAVARTFGPYKLSLHSGSDKFSIYAIAAEAAGELLHLKTAGTSYLEALRTVATVEPALFRQILTFSCERYPVDRATYQVSGSLAKVPALKTLDDAELPRMLDQFDARQILHVTYGSVLQNSAFKQGIESVLRQHEQLHYSFLSKHFERHLLPFV